MMAYSWMDVVSIALNLIFGGGFIITLLTLRAQRKKAGAEAKGAEATAESTELDNVEKAIKIWREMAESLKTQLSETQSNYTEMAKQVEGLRKDVNRLNCTSNRILKMLNQITHENMEKLVSDIKDEIQKSDA